MIVPAKVVVDYSSKSQETAQSSERTAVPLILCQIVNYQAAISNSPLCRKNYDTRLIKSVRTLRNPVRILLQRPSNFLEMVVINFLEIVVVHWNYMRRFKLPVCLSYQAIVPNCAYLDAFLATSKKKKKKDQKNGCSLTGNA